MRRQPSNVSWVRDAGLCCGCGTCEAACPEDAIRVTRDRKKGIYLPEVDAGKCTSCGRCIQICPGASVDFKGLTKEILDGETSEGLLGCFHQCFTGWATSHDMRHHSSSGGLVSALLIHALEKKVIDGALVLGMSEGNPLETAPVLATTPEQVIAACGSKYCPSAINIGLKDILATNGRFAAVGLPCHVHALRKWQAIDPRLREKIPLCLGIFCANENTYLATEYFLRTNGIEPSRVKSIRYRDDGWPGIVKVTIDDGSKHIIRRGTTEPSWRRRALFTSAFHYDFQVPRCLLCADLTAELADIALGDAWLDKYMKTEKVGISFAITRTKKGAEFLQAAADAGVVELQPMPLEDARKAQNYAFKGTVGSRIRLRRAFGRPAPDYGARALPAKAGVVLSAFRYLPSYVSHHRWLWPALRINAVMHGLFRMVLGRTRATIKQVFRRFKGRKAV